MTLKGSYPNQLEDRAINSAIILVTLLRSGEPSILFKHEQVKRSRGSSFQVITLNLHLVKAEAEEFESPDLFTGRRLSKSVQ